MFLVLMTSTLSSETHSQAISAAAASAKLPPRAATKKDVVHAFMRIAWSEATQGSVADENIVYQTLLSRSRLKTAFENPTRFMYWMGQYSNRTFPVDSPFIEPERAAQTERQLWVSSLRYDCERGDHWPAGTPWTGRRVHKGVEVPSYRDECLALRERTWRRLAGKEPNWCTNRVDHWGGDMDVDNPKQGKWVKVNCDESGVTCNAFREQGVWYEGCAQNTAWCSPTLGGC